MLRRPATATRPESWSHVMTRLPSFHDHAPAYFPRRPRSPRSDAAIGPSASTCSSTAVTNAGVTLRPCPEAGGVGVHAPSEQRVEGRRQQRGGVAEVLEQLVA